MVLFFYCSFIVCKKVDTKFVIELLKENGYMDLPFTAKELLKYWEKGPMYSRRKRKTKTKHKKQK